MTENRNTVVYQDSINALCNIINALQQYPLKYTHFLAHKNVSSLTTLAFWNVLHNLTCGSNCDDIVYCTKYQMVKRGYRSPYFYFIEKDIASHSSHWELILAFSWLICSGVIEENVDDIVLKLFKCDLKQRQPSPPKLNSNRRSLLVCNSDPLNSLRKLYFDKCNYSISSSEKIKLVSEANRKATERTPFGIPLAISSLLNDEQLKTFIKKTSNCKHLIDLYILWKVQEKRYMKWVDISLKKEKQLKITNEVSFSTKGIKPFLADGLKSISEDKVADCADDSQAFSFPQIQETIIDFLSNFGLCALKCL